ncbi:Nuclear pore complex subunit Nup159 [Balamuthia mandrillaris]
MTESDPEDDFQEEIDWLRFVEFGSTRVHRPLENLESCLQLIAVSNRFGHTVLAGRDGNTTVVLVARTKALIQSAKQKEPFRPSADNCVRLSPKGKVRFVGFSCDELLLALCHFRNIRFYSVAEVLSKKEPISPVANVKICESGKISSFAWSPSSPTTYFALTAEGHLYVSDLAAGGGGATTLQQLAGPGRTHFRPTSACWSPMGKLLACGCASGEVVLLEAGTGAVKRIIPRPPLNDEDGDDHEVGADGGGAHQADSDGPQFKVHYVSWLEENLLAVGMSSASEAAAQSEGGGAEEVDEETRFFLASMSQAGTTFRRFTVGMEEPTLQNMYHTLCLKQWGALLVGGTNFPEIELLGSLKAAQQQQALTSARDWNLWVLPDSSRAEMPMPEEDEGVDHTPHLFGMALDYTWDEEILNPDSSPDEPSFFPPSPILLCFTDVGVLSAFAFVNSDEEGPSPLMRAPEPLPRELPAFMRQPTSGSASASPSGPPATSVSSLAPGSAGGGAAGMPPTTTQGLVGGGGAAATASKSPFSFSSGAFSSNTSAASPFSFSSSFTPSSSSSAASSTTTTATANAQKPPLSFSISSGSSADAAATKPPSSVLFGGAATAPPAGSAGAPVTASATTGATVAKTPSPFSFGSNFAAPQSATDKSKTSAAAEPGLSTGATAATGGAPKFAFPVPSASGASSSSLFGSGPIAAAKPPLTSTPPASSANLFNIGGDNAGGKKGGMPLTSTPTPGPAFSASPSSVPGTTFKEPPPAKKMAMAQPSEAAAMTRTKETPPHSASAPAIMPSGGSIAAPPLQQQTPNPIEAPKVFVPGGAEEPKAKPPPDLTSLFEEQIASFEETLQEVSSLWTQTHDMMSRIQYSTDEQEQAKASTDLSSAPLFTEQGLLDLVHFTDELIEMADERSTNLSQQQQQTHQFHQQLIETLERFTDAESLLASRTDSAYLALLDSRKLDPYSISMKTKIESLSSQVESNIAQVDKHLHELYVSLRRTHQDSSPIAEALSGAVSASSLPAKYRQHRKAPIGDVLYRTLSNYYTIACRQADELANITAEYKRLKKQRQYSSFSPLPADFNISPSSPLHPAYSPVSSISSASSSRRGRRVGDDVRSSPYDSRSPSVVATRRTPVEDEKRKTPTSTATHRRKREEISESGDGINSGGSSPYSPSSSQRRSKERMSSLKQVLTQRVHHSHKLYNEEEADEHFSQARKHKFDDDHRRSPYGYDDYERDTDREDHASYSVADRRRDSPLQREREQQRTQALAVAAEAQHKRQAQQQQSEKEQEGVKEKEQWPSFNLASSVTKSPLARAHAAISTSPSTTSTSLPSTTTTTATKTTSAAPSTFSFAPSSSTSSSLFGATKPSATIGGSGGGEGKFNFPQTPPSTAVEWKGSGGEKKATATTITTTPSPTTTSTSAPSAYTISAPPPQTTTATATTKSTTPTATTPLFSFSTSASAPSSSSTSTTTTATTTASKPLTSATTSSAAPSSLFSFSTTAAPGSSSLFKKEEPKTQATPAPSTTTNVFSFSSFAPPTTAASTKAASPTTIAQAKPDEDEDKPGGKSATSSSSSSSSTFNFSSFSSLGLGDDATKKSPSPIPQQQTAITKTDEKTGATKPIISEVADGDASGDDVYDDDTEAVDSDVDNDDFSGSDTDEEGAITDEPGSEQPPKQQQGTTNTFDFKPLSSPFKFGDKTAASSSGSFSSLFGSATKSSSEPASSSSSSTTTTGASSLFGNNTTSTNKSPFASGGGLFGSSTSSAGASGAGGVGQSPFTPSTASSTSSLFGSSSSTSSTPSSSLFGTSSSSSSSIFGTSSSSTTSASPFSSFLSAAASGSVPAPSFGSTTPISNSAPTTTTTPKFGAPSFGTPSFGSTGFGGGAAGAPAAFGKPSFGVSGFGSTAASPSAAPSGGSKPLFGGASTGGGFAQFATSGGATSGFAGVAAQPQPSSGGGFASLVSGSQPAAGSGNAPGGGGGDIWSAIRK